MDNFCSGVVVTRRFQSFQAFQWLQSFQRLEYYDQEIPCLVAGAAVICLLPPQPMEQRPMALHVRRR